MSADTAALQARAAVMRRDIVRLSYQAKTGHIGSSLSCVDLIVATNFHFMSNRPAQDPQRDRFLMSKGHACVPLYSVLAERGRCRATCTRATESTADRWAITQSETRSSGSSSGPARWGMGSRSVAGWRLPRSSRSNRGGWP
nr:hypothetical protein Hi04_10k_c3883_00034 [uncultured bacterium]